MKQEWQHDVAVLKARVANAEKNDPGLTGVREYCANTGKSWLRRAYYDDVKGAVLFSGRTQLR